MRRASIVVYIYISDELNLYQIIDIYINVWKCLLESYFLVS